MLDPDATNSSDSQYLSSPEQFKAFGHSAMMVNLVKDIMDMLERQYPGWLWAVQPHPGESVIRIFSMRLSGEYGYTIKTSDIQYDPNLKEAIRAGGEILERFRCPKRAHQPGDTLTLMKDIRGNFIPDITDDSSQNQKKDRDRRLSEAVRDGKVEIAHKDITTNGETRRHLALKINPEETADEE